MASVGSYNLAAIVLVVHGFILSGFGEDAAIDVAFSSDVVESKVSADGAHVSVSRLNDPRATVTITVMEGTRAARILDELEKAQSALPGFTVSPFRLFDPNSGDEVTDQHSIFTKRPNMTKGRAAGERVYELLLPNAVKGTKHAQLIP